MKNNNGKSKVKEDKFNFYIGASTIISVEKCLRKTARFYGPNGRSDDIENLLQFVSTSIFSDNIFVPTYITVLKNVKEISKDKLKEYGITNIEVGEINTDIANEAAQYGVGYLVHNLERIRDIITAKNTVTTYSGIASRIDTLMEDWQKLLYTGKTMERSKKIGQIYLTVAEDSYSLERLSNIAKEEGFSSTDCLKLYDFIKYYANLYITSELKYIYVPNVSRLSVAKCIARASNKENYDIRKLTSETLQTAIFNEGKSTYLPSLHKALLVRSKGTVGGLFDVALELKEKIKNIKKQLPDVWVVDDKKEFKNWIREMSVQLKNELEKSCKFNHNSKQSMGIELDLNPVGFKLKTTGLSISNSVDILKKINIKRKTKNYLSMLVDLAKDAGIEDDTDCLIYYHRLCKECGQN